MKEELRYAKAMAEHKEGYAEIAEELEKDEVV